MTFIDGLTMNAVKKAFYVELKNRNNNNLPRVEIFIFIAAMALSDSI